MMLYKTFSMSVSLAIFHMEMTFNILKISANLGTIQPVFGCQHQHEHLYTLSIIFDEEICKKKQKQKQKQNKKKPKTKQKTKINLINKQTRKEKQNRTQRVPQDTACQKLNFMNNFTLIPTKYRYGSLKKSTIVHEHGKICI